MQKLKPISYKIIFNRNHKLNKEGKAPISIRAYQNGIQKIIPTGITIFPKYWDKKRLEVKKKHPKALILNRRLRLQLQAMEDYEGEMIRRYGEFSVEKIGNYDAFERNESFTQFIDTRLKEDNLSKGTVKTRRTTLKKLLQYNKGKAVHFSDLTYKFIKGFDNYLFRKDLSINTVLKHHKHLINYINVAINFDLMDRNRNPYQRFRPKRETKEMDFLMPCELERISKLNLIDSSLERVRDMFLMQCYTGLRISDITRISVAHIHKTDKGLLLKFVAEKTGKKGELPLYQLFKAKEGRTKPEKIINDYLKKNTLGIPFFKMTTQYANRQLKEIAKLAHISKPLTTKYGRHTFGTILGAKVPLALLQNLMQHSRPDETARYIHNNPLLRDSELNKVKWHD